MVFYVDSQKSSSAEEIAFLLNKCILQYPGRWSELVFLCIGSDRVTGDCLGPYIGHQLLEHLNTDTHGVYVYGTLKSPVHAVNLSECRPCSHRVDAEAVECRLHYYVGGTVHA